MSIKRFKSTKDNTITDAFKADLTGRGTSGSMGASDILEVFSIHAQANESSLEKSRIIIEFPVDEISTKRASAEIPKSGSVSFKLKMFNAEHSQTTPSQYWLSAHPILQSWTEGSGMDMEAYLNEGVSNWYTANTGDDWTTAGGTYPDPSLMHLDENNAPMSFPSEYTQYFDNGTESVDMDITEFVENWIVEQEGNAVAATGSLFFFGNPSSGETITLYSTSGEYKMIQFSTSSLLEKNTLYVDIKGTYDLTAAELNTKINTLVPGLFTSTIDGSDASKIHFTQSVAGIYGNTILSASTDVGKTLGHFAGGKGTKNNGLLIKLSGSFEDGTNSKSYYTKKFFSRTSQFYMKRPLIEAQIDDANKDDRGNFYRETVRASDADNLNTIYLYNRVRGEMKDLPGLSNGLLSVSLYSGSTGDILDSTGGGQKQSVKISGGSSATIVSAGYISGQPGVYSASFAYAGNLDTLYDQWYTGTTAGSNLKIYSSGSIGVKPSVTDAEYASPSFVVNISNLKPSYNTNERALFRVYTRNKNWKPNVYTVASQAAPVDIINDGFYKVKRVADNLDVISYSTGSTPSYSGLSYDVNGSYFELDMSILEPNYLYEISFLRKEGSEYIEQKERFKFRIDS